ncbi:MAG: hypothetical protein P8J37_02840 [Fuerstiella sp.]|nr:hypothetical protein [Fuerstiella sp.]
MKQFRFDGCLWYDFRGSNLPAQRILHLFNIFGIRCEIDIGIHADGAVRTAGGCTQTEVAPFLR